MIIPAFYNRPKNSAYKTLQNIRLKSCVTSIHFSGLENKVTEERNIFVQLKYSENAVTLCEGEEINLICENQPISGLWEKRQPISYVSVIREMLLSSENKIRRVQFIQWTEKESDKERLRMQRGWSSNHRSIFILISEDLLRKGSKIISRSVLSQSR